MKSLHNFISILLNGQNVFLLHVTVHKSVLTEQVLSFFLDYGLIRGYASISPFTIRIYLKYSDRSTVIKQIRFISKPSKRVYTTAKILLKLKEYKLKLVVLSTSQGLLTSDEALKQNVGGELLFIVL